MILKILQNILFHSLGFYTKRNRSLTMFFILVANCIPFFGVLFFHWTLSKILWLYGFESIIIAVFNLPKIFFAAWKFQKENSKSLGINQAINLTMLAILIYGLFMGAHLFILLPIITRLINFPGTNNPNLEGWIDLFSFQLFELIPDQEITWITYIFSPVGASILVFIYFQILYLFLFFAQKEYFRNNYEYYFGILTMRIGLLQGTLLFSLPIILFLLWLLPNSISALVCSIWVSIKVIVELLYVYFQMDKDKIQN